MIILLVKCTLFFLLQTFYLLERAVSSTVLLYDAGCSVPKMLYVPQRVTFGGKIASKDVMTIWIINIVKCI